MSFRDTFTKSSSSENLQYDDNAAYHFYITILAIVGVGLTWSVGRRILYPFAHITSLELVENSPHFKQKIQRFKKDNRWSYVSFTFILKVIVLILVAFAIFHCVGVLRENDDSIRGFDPYEILQVDPDAPIEKIKKSYRKLALKYHPDRNKNDPQASARFIMISKAYQCLTDEEKKQNCMKFGNPQGSTSFNVGIALPSLLVKKQNQVIIMAVVFVLVAIILPIVLIYYFSEVNKYDEYGMLQESHPYIHSVLNQHFSTSDCVRCLSFCMEFKNFRITREESDKLDALFKQADEDLRKVFLKKKYFNYIKKAMVLIDSRVNERAIPRQLEADYHIIMKKIPILIKASIMLGLERSGYIVSKMRPDVFVGANALQSLILFGQRFIQGKSFDAEPFEQLELTEAEVDKIYKKKRKRKLDLEQLKQETQDQEFLFKNLDPERISLIKQELSYLPTLDLEAGFNIPEGEYIALGDSIEVMVMIKSNRKSSFCAAHSYPFLKKEGWYMIAQQNNKVEYLEHFRVQKDEYNTKFNLPPRMGKGKNELTIKILSDCYFGMDIETKIKYEVGNERKIAKEEKSEIDELAGQSFMERMMSSLKPPEEEQLSDNEQPVKAADKKKEKDELSDKED